MPLPAEAEAERGVLHELLELREATARRRSASVELVARSSFSFLAGASSPEALVRTAAALGYDTLGVCDLHGLYGMVRAHEEAKKLGVRLVVGAELVCPLGVSGGLGERRAHVAVHVESHEGYKNLCRVLSQAHALRPRDERAKAEVMLSHLAEHARGLFVTLLDGDREAGREAAAVLAQAFGARASVAATLRLDGHDRERMSAVEDLSRTFALPVLATNRVLFALREDRALFDVLSCIRLKTTLDRAGRALLPNAEAHLKSEDAMHRLFSAHPGWLARSRAVADACTFSLTELDYRFPSDACVEERETPDAALRRLTYEGARLRYDAQVPEKVAAQLEKELALIAQLELAPYFLSVRQVVDMARRRDILCQGRGSAANSAVCYCLGVTAVDPARSSMLFERFLSAERAEPPDIDVDFEHERREEVIQEIYATYGRDRAAMVSEVVAYRGKSALREAGKVFGLSPEQVERLASVVSFWDGLSQLDTTQALRLAEAGFDPADPRILHVCAIARKMQGVPRHLSVHVGGFVLSSTDLCEVAPVEPATMEGRTVIPWDKDDIDALGFFKVDVLALGMLTAIRKALELVKDDPRLCGATSAIERLARIPPEDPLVYDALCRADTVGVFQIESRAQMAMLPRLQPRCFYDLVVEVAIVRPGPIQGGMVHPYLRRRSGEEAPDAPHPLIAPVLERTLGVPLFQEQVMQLAIVGAGYTGGEADQLRRDMAAWKRHGGLSRHEARLAEGFAKNGISAEFGARLYAQIKGFGEYGFPESHAASFALLVYASAWLKVHHPAAFAAALLNSQPMGFYSPSSILEDARRHGVRALPVCALSSDWDTTLAQGEQGATLRVGLREVRGLPEEVGRRLVLEARRAPFTDVADVEQRAGVRKDHLVALAEAGAFAALPAMGARREAMWAALAPTRAPLFARASSSAPRASTEAHALPAALPVPPLTRAEQLLLDYERTGLSVTDHPMRIARRSLGKGVLSSRELASAPHGARVQSAGVVLCRQRPGTASGVVFITLEDEHGFVNLVLYARVYERLRRVATTASMLVVEGKVERQPPAPPTNEPHGAPQRPPAAPVVYIVVERLERLSLHAGGARGARGLPSRSRDFR